MTIWLIEPSTYRAPLAEWPMLPATRVMNSDAYDRLHRDIDRFVRGHVRGRSYLIAGHRGAGKTSLSIRAVEELASDILRQSVLAAGDGLPEGPIQRPLLIKLEGPSMLEEQHIPSADPPPKPKKAAQGSEGDDEFDMPEGTVSAGAHAALVQITIGLYRALAQEAAAGFRAHARHLGNRPPADQSERAAQLALDLDGGADAGRLRGYWAGLGRLNRGVFWPATADKSLGDHGMRDQGLREITALATAAQAFQVCTGRIRYSATSKDSLERSRIAELKGSSDIRDAVARLGTLGLGAITGVSILGTTSAGAGAALAGGLTIWLLGTLSFSWSDKRTRTNARSVDYSFIRDSSLATLGRDLPVVVARVREAGLAPVFIIDELDKVKDAPRALADLVGKLKHLIADYGFFCFLVNRDCYETIEARIRDRSYPLEHTLFGERLLLRPDPTKIFPYLLDLVAFDPATPLSGQARAAFALVAMHEARLNLTDLVRVLGRYQRGPGWPIGADEELTAQRKLVQATVQLAIDQTLRSDLLAERIADDPIFAQCAIDTLYYPSRQWQKGMLDIDPDRDILRAHLVERMRQDDEADGTPAAVTNGGNFPLNDDDMGRLHKALAEMLHLLANLDKLRELLGDRTASGIPGDPDPGDVRLADLVPQDIKAIAKETNGRFQFLYAADGEEIVENGGRLREKDRSRISFLISYTRALLDIVHDCGTDLDELALTPLLNSVASSGVHTALDSLDVALRLGDSDPDVLQHVSVLERLFKEATGRRDGFGNFLILAASLRRDASVSGSVVLKIARLIQFRLRPQNWYVGSTLGPRYALPHEPALLLRWRADLFGALLPANTMVLRSAAAPYMSLVEPLRGYFAELKRPPPLKPDYGMLFDAARGRVPGSVLCTDMTKMSARDWSQLALSAIPGGRAAKTPAPFWVLIAALRALGFGREALEELADPSLNDSLAKSGFTVSSAEMPADYCFALALEFARGAPEQRPGILVVEGPNDRFASGRPNSRVPALIIDRRSYKDYLPFIAWLTALGILVTRVAGLDDVEDE